MSPPAQSLSTRTKVIGALTAAALASVLALVLSKRGVSNIDPPKREPGQAAASSARADATADLEFADKRWKQRTEERLAMRDVAGEPARAAGGPGDSAPGQRGARGGALGAAPPSGLGIGSDPTRAADTIDAAVRDDPAGARLSFTGPTVNTRLGADGTSPSGASTTPGKPSSGNGSATRAALSPGGVNTKPVVGCGDGVIQSGELCEPAGSPKCGDDCTPLVSDACYDCEVNSHCVPLASACNDFPTNPFDKSLCYDVAHCIQDTGCAAGDKTLTSCFCGEMGMEQCRSAPPEGDKAPHGACADVIRNGMGEGVSNVFVLTHYTSRSTPAGTAIMRFQCLKADASCGSVCFPK